MGGSVRERNWRSSAGDLAAIVVAPVPHWLRPTALALALALPSWPVVALTLGAVDPSRYVGGGEPPASSLGQWSAAAGAVLFSALIAGTLGGLLVRRQAIMGGVVTFVLALWVAQATATVLPLALGEHVGVACRSALGPGMSSGSPCDPIITTTNALDFGYDLLRAGYLWLAPFAEPIPVLTLAVGVIAWTTILGRRPSAHRDQQPTGWTWGAQPR